MMAESIPDILYIMGSGRSGTTVLEIVLSNNPGMLSAGEMTHIFKDGFDRQIECACGSTIQECDAWQAVYAEFATSDLTDIQNTSATLESHKSMLRHFLGAFDKPTLEKYADINQRVFQKLAINSQPNVIIDSSKFAGRAIALSRAFPGKVKIIAFTRSPAGLIHSFLKPNKDEQLPKSPFQTFLYYCFILTSIKIAQWRVAEPILKLRYEELISSPASTLEKIAEWTNLDLSESIDRVKNDRDLTIGHIVTGNRIRKLATIRLMQESGKPVLTGISSLVMSRLMDIYRVLLRL